MNQPYSSSSELRQSLLELHYDLLDEPVAAKLRAAIDSDPEVAAQWTQTLALANKMAVAAKPPCASDDPLLARLSLPTPSEPIKSSEPNNSSKSRSLWITPSIVAAIAACLGFIVIAWRNLEDLPAAPRGAVRIEAKIVPGTAANRRNEFRLVTSRIDGESLRSGRVQLTPAILSFSVLAKSQVLLRGTTQTDRSGAGTIVLPPELVVPREAKLEVTASSLSNSLASSTVSVPLEPTRCLTYLTVDRPVYRPGETLYFRSLTLERSSLRPLVEVPIRYEVIDPSGAVVPGLSSEGLSNRGVGNGAFSIPSTAPGGPYTLVTKSLDGFFPEERRDFEVRSYRTTRLITKLEFENRSYGAGDTVQAALTTMRAEGGPVSNAQVRLFAKVDDAIVLEQTAITSDDGTLAISFHLPTHLKKGVGHLSVTVDDGGTRETTTKSIPIHTGRAEVSFYPEGGYLVADLHNRIYFTARDTVGNPIQLAGEVQDRRGHAVATLATIRDGMGRFEFTPQLGERYTLKVTEPIDVVESPALPAVVGDLPVIDTGVGVYEADSAIAMSVRSTVPRDVIVRGVCRGKLVGEAQVSLRVGTNPIELNIAGDAGGVIRVTVFDANTTAPKPLVERLVYRRSTNKLNVEITDTEDQLQRAPGESLRVNLQVRDETGEPAPAVLGVAVVDEAALNLDKTNRPTMTTHFLLTSEVDRPEDLEHANFYLAEGNDAAESLDLLLGTQGWRRFVSGSPNQPTEEFREQLVRLLELDGNASTSGSQVFENAATTSYQWSRYREAVASAWQIIVLQTRLLLAGILVLWVVSLAIRIRRFDRIGSMAGVLIMAISLYFVGCGSQAPSMIASDGDARELGMALPDGEAHVGALDPNAQRPENTIDAQIDLLLRGLSPQSETLAELKRAGFIQPNAGTGVDSPRITSEQLKQLLASRGLDAQTLADQLLDELRFPVRQYAHVHPTSMSALREDFAETLCWQPLLITDSQGQASIRFDLSDSVTTYRVSVDAHSTDGRIGSFAGAIRTSLPFQIEPQLPLEVTAGDRIDMPIAIYNASDTASKVSLALSTTGALVVSDPAARTVLLDAGQRSREFVSLEVLPSSNQHDTSVTIAGSSDSMSDTIRKPLKVAPAGYPVSQSLAGVLTGGGDGRATAKLRLPSDVVDGSLTVTVRAYPSPVADIMSGVESILREPHGCFEQASATNYPNAMALLYLQQSQAENPDVAKRALAMLDRGYDKLTSFECDKLGYEWFGSDPGHEALSAFGLMQFTDMSKVMKVSEAMVARTRLWLLDRRDGSGGFKRNPRHLHVWSVEQDIVNAYIMWALTEADVAAGQPARASSELSKELDQLSAVATTSRDPYLIALSAAALLNVGRSEAGERLLAKLVELQNPDGSLTGNTTVVSSGGLSLTMETTALAMIAWAKNARYAGPTELACNWIKSNRLGSGGFGSTQATVLALKAMLAASGTASTDAPTGTLQVWLGETKLGEANIAPNSSSDSVVEIAGLGEKIVQLTQDLQSVELGLVATGASRISYAVEVTCHSPTPSSSERCPLKLSTEFDVDREARSGVPVGATIRVTAELENVSRQGHAMAVAVIGLPGGVEPRLARLDELKLAGHFDYYELRGRDVVFYWRNISPDFKESIEFDVTAVIPGNYTGPASKAYLYYTAEEKCWCDPLKIMIRQD